VQPPDPYFITKGVDMEETRYVGIDVGKATMEVRILSVSDAKIKVLKFNGKTDAIGRARLMRELTPKDIIGIEAGEPAFTIAREIRNTVGARVLALNPGRLAIIYKSTRKTDAEDAMKLARLVMRFTTEELPVVKIPDGEELVDRALVSEHAFLKATRTKLICRLHSVYLRAGITSLIRKDLKVPEKRKQALSMLVGKPDHFASEATRLELFIQPIESQIEIIETEMKSRLAGNENTPYLMSVPGTGPALAMAVIAHLGDGSRFESGSQVSNYVGFVPRIDISGKSVRFGHITKHGCSAIRRVAVQAAWALVRAKSGACLRDKYNDLRSKRGKRIAIVAIARKLVELLWTLMTKKEFYKYASEEELKFKFRFYKMQFKGSVA
jgi:transposase